MKPYIVTSWGISESRSTEVEELLGILGADKDGRLGNFNAYLAILSPQGKLVYHFDGAQSGVSGRRDPNFRPHYLAEEFAEGWVDYLAEAHEQYTPHSFWDDLDVYVQMTVEKIDLKNLFAPICAQFRVATTNVSGWSDFNRRVQIMQRFAHWERQGKKCVLLHCGDHDPGGLQISAFLRSNLEDLAKAVGWHPRKLHIERFGLNYKFIQAQRLTWIENLETSSGERLDDRGHNDHHKDYVQSYLRKFDARKVEANALVTRPAAGRALCRAAILKYVPADAPDRYEQQLRTEREAVRREIARLMRRWGRAK